MLIANHKPICLIGYENSTLTQEACYFVSAEHTSDVFVVEPETFLSWTNELQQQYQYGVAFTLDRELRQHVITVIDQKQLDCFRFVHDTVVCYNKNLAEVIGKGSFIAPFSSCLLGSKLGNHCIVESYCLISHYASLGDNVQLHSGVMIAGKTKIGSNSIFNFKASALNALTLCDNIEVGAVSTVTKNIDISGYYVGSPARRVGDYQMKIGI